MASLPTRCILFVTTVVVAACAACVVAFARLVTRLADGPDVADAGFLAGSGAIPAGPGVVRAALVGIAGLVPAGGVPVPP